MQEQTLAGRTIAVPERRELDVFASMLERRGAIKVSTGFAAATITGFVYSCWAFYGAGLEASLWSLLMTAAGLPIYLLMRRSAPARREETPVA